LKSSPRRALKHPPTLRLVARLFLQRSIFPFYDQRCFHLAIPALVRALPRVLPLLRAILIVCLAE
jgi:hypothetical protein